MRVNFLVFCHQIFITVFHMHRPFGRMQQFVTLVNE
jgi:hypothetical protein